MKLIYCFLSYLSTFYYSLDLSHGSRSIHILSNVWEWVLITVHVWPSLLLGSLVKNVLIAVSSHHRLIFLVKFNLVVQEMLGVSEVLNGPLVFLGLHILLVNLGIDDLASLGGLDIINLVWSQPLEVVWHKSMWSQLRLGCVEILSHDIAHVCPLNLKSILILLILFPCVFPISLLLGHLLIERCKILHLVCLFVGRFVLKDSSHSSDSFGLLSVILVLLGLPCLFPFVLASLLLNPLFLQLGVIGHSSMVG